MDDVTPYNVGVEVGKLLESPELVSRCLDDQEDRGVVQEAVTSAIMTLMRRAYEAGFQDGSLVERCHDIMWADGWKGKIDLELCKSEES